MAANRGSAKKQGWLGRLKDMSADAVAEMRHRMDSWSNALTGLNQIGRDKTTFTLPVFDAPLSQLLLEALYHSDDIANRIVTAVPDECFREPFQIVCADSDPDRQEEIQEKANELEQDFTALGARAKLHEAQVWGRNFGLGAVLIGVDDGRDTWEPIDYDNVRSIDYLTVLDKRDLTPWRWYADPLGPKFGDVAVYLMQPVGVFVGAPYDLMTHQTVILVHESRMIRFGGELTSKRQRLANQGSDYSILQRCFRALQLVNDNWQSAAGLLADASQAVLKIKGLMDMISQQPDIMQQRFTLMDMVRSTLRMILLDAEDEDFARVQSHFEGIPEMLDQTWTRLAAAARIPKQVLIGESPGGLNAGASGESNLRWWYDTIGATQQQQIKPAVEYLCYLLALAKSWDVEQDRFSCTFPALKQLDALQEAQRRAAMANADNIYLTTGVLHPEEVALSRFGSGKFSEETTIDVQSRKRIMKTAVAVAETEAENELEAAEDPAPTPGDQAAQEAQAERTPDPKPPGNVTQ